MLHSYKPLSPFQQKLISTRQSYQFILRDGIDQGANGLHDAEELLICGQTKIMILNSDIMNKAK